MNNRECGALEAVDTLLGISWYRFKYNY